MLWELLSDMKQIGSITFHSMQFLHHITFYRSINIQICSEYAVHKILCNFLQFGKGFLVMENDIIRRIRRKIVFHTAIDSFTFRNFFQTVLQAHNALTFFIN